MRNIFYRISSAMARFMYGRNGADQLGSAMLVLYVVLFVLQVLFSRVRGVYNVLSGGWTKSINILPARIARPFAASLRGRGKSRSPVPDAGRKFREKAEPGAPGPPRPPAQASPVWAWRTFGQLPPDSG